MPFDDRIPNKNELKKKPFIKGLEEAKEEHAKVEQIKQEAKMNLKEKAPEFKKLAKNQYLIPRVKEYEEDLECSCTLENGACGDESECLAAGLNIECTNKTCKLGDKCQNRKLQRREWKKVKPAKTLHCGYGLHADEDVKEGELVIEYIGEVMDRNMMEDRLKKCQAKGINTYYLMALSRDLFIDARIKASNARFINHACNPNCKTVIWESNGEKKAGIYALTDIPKGTEFTYDYDFDYLDDKSKCKCFCGAANCGGFIGVKKKVEAAAPTTIKVRPSKSAYAFFCDVFQKQYKAEQKSKTNIPAPSQVTDGESDPVALEAKKLAAKEAAKEEAKKEGKIFREKAKATWDAMLEDVQAPYIKLEEEWRVLRAAETKKAKGRKKKKSTAAVVKKPVTEEPIKECDKALCCSVSPLVEEHLREGSETTVASPATPEGTVRQTEKEADALIVSTSASGVTA